MGLFNSNRAHIIYYTIYYILCTNLLNTKLYINIKTNLFNIGHRYFQYIYINIYIYIYTHT